MDRRYGNDGVAHLTFFDPTTQLSFTWDPSHDDDAIEVSAGGYREPVVDEFDAFDFDAHWGEAENLAEHVHRFEVVCKLYIARVNDPTAIEDALRRGYREGLGDVGITFDGDPSSPRSVAYDTGRTLRRKQAGLE